MVVVYLVYYFLVFLLCAAICWEFTFNALLWLALYFRNPAVIPLTRRFVLVLIKEDNVVKAHHYDRQRPDHETFSYTFSDEDAHRVVQLCLR